WMMEQANDALLLISADGRIVHVNGRAEQLYGRSREELLALRVHDLNTGGSAAAEERTKAVLRTGSSIFESEHWRADGTAIPVEVSSKVLDESGDRTFIAIVRDIRERKAAEARRAEEILALEQIAAGASLSDMWPRLLRLVEEDGLAGSIVLA